MAIFSMFGFFTTIQIVESLGRVKGGVTVKDERGPGLDLSLCFVCGSRP